MLYAILVVAIIISSFGFSFLARKSIESCKTEEERKETKEKWQVICGLVGFLATLIVIVLSFNIIF